VIALGAVGSDFLLQQINGLTDHVDELSPSEFNETHRFLPRSTSPHPGPFDLRWTPYWKEPLDNQDPRDPTRETVILKGVQVGYNVSLVESALLYLAAYQKTLAGIFASLDKEMASERVGTNILPMFDDSGFGDIFQSTDLRSTHKTGKTKNHLQWLGGGYLLIYGATNINKIRSFGVPVLILDEIDAEQWDGRVSGGGDKVGLFRKRCRAYWAKRKIIVGSSPLLDGSSRIEREYNRGDRREYQCRCLECGEPQTLRWSGTNKDTGKSYGFAWDYNGEGQLDIKTVRYVCKYCYNPHFEEDKPRFISEENSFWKPTAVAVEPNIRSYHVPSFLSLISPWSEAIGDWLTAMDPKTNKVLDVSALQGFYNNHLGKPFKLLGGKIQFEAVSSHRRAFYRRNEIKNKEVKNHCDSEILFLTCAVDVHKSNLAVAIWGWTAGFVCWLIDYVRLTDDSAMGCDDPKSPTWGQLQDLIDNETWKSDNGKEYRLILTLVDAGYNNSLVVDFCAIWEAGVIPIVGRERPARAASIKEFSEFSTSHGTLGYKIIVDHYKDRLAPVLQRQWHDAEGKQSKYTFNAPVDIDDIALKELTREYRREKKQPNGETTYYWHRPGNAPQELWDLLVYAHASVEIIAWAIAKESGADSVDWFDFWAYCETGAFYD
jgi:phage terminase large subunit GpA-like protein